MQRALQLAGRALGNTAPNPAVGAVLVRDGDVLGEGWTRPAGHDHAEVVALKACRAHGQQPAGATMYVTLEPCCHHGRTPPCTDALLEAGVARVVVGVRDPFPAVRGRGLEQLRAAGVEVTVGVEADACAHQVLGFARSVTAGLPEVTAKAAVSLDGHIATATGESQWITGPQARLDGHRLRASHDAILVGIGTVLADDPRLTTRLPPDDAAAAPACDPVPVVLDTHLRCPADARLLSAGRRAVLVCGTEAPERALDADVVRVALGDDGRVDVVEALRAVAGRGLHRVLVEGGGEVHRSLLDRGVVDTLHLYVAGVVVPGGRPWVGGAPLERLADAPRMVLQEVSRLGPDARLTWHLTHALAPDPVSAAFGATR
jgi:diaminohydroxyphosphoribosylaminopyrimidine deaminase/5-amino-6-(5-phosphoribosylamino)uracil reductase